MHRVIELAPRDRLELKRATGTRLEVTHGRLWLTQEGDLDDHVLGAGDGWTLTRPELALAEAQEKTTVIVRGTAGLTTRSFADWTLPLLRTWRQWLRGTGQRPLPYV